ncbi:uncharacterized protein V1510DRAFT_404500 [Dipodascopsis tothii]|uniref:uncharacterized protein n=1 Tax=Dipodascopsis tothii TaxID=44089 RepID=UPI0034CFE323
MTEINNLLRTIAGALGSATAALGKVDAPADTDGVSLLTLKTELLESYVQALAVQIAGAVGSAAGRGPAAERARQLLVTDRVTLEKGVRPLEKKIEYQLTKLVEAARQQDAKAAARSQTGSDDDGSDDDEDALAFRPRPEALAAAAAPASASGAYVAPRISAARPAAKGERPARAKRNFALEEYIAEHGTGSGAAPEAAPSVGSTTRLVKVGRGRQYADKSERELREDARVRDYEEDNFVRTDQFGGKKRAAKKARGRAADQFMGEDWGFTNKRKGATDGIYDAVKRKRPRESVWERNRGR